MHYQEKLMLRLISEKEKGIDQIREDKGYLLEHYEEALSDYSSSVELILKYLADKSIDEAEYIRIKRKCNKLRDMRFKYQKDEDKNNEEWYNAHVRLKMNFSSLKSWTSYARDEEIRKVKDAERDIICLKDDIPSRKEDSDALLARISSIEDEILKLQERLEVWKKVPAPRRWITHA